MSLFADYNFPFAVALGIMVLLAVAQVVGIGDLIGDGDADVDLDVDIDGDGISSAGAMEGLMSLIGIGRVPFIIWLASFLFIFAGLGVSIQMFAGELTGSPLYSWLAALIAGGAALPVNGFASRVLGAILPKDETTAVSVATLVGRRARILDGTARASSPAKGQVRDHFGQVHNVMVEPHDIKEELQAGETVLLVRREGETFYASRLDEPRLSPA